MAVMFNESQHPRGPGGQWTAGGGAGSARAQRGKKGTARSGANDLYQIAKASGVSEARLLQLNPGLRRLAGTGRSVPLGTTVAVSASGRKAAARSQTSRSTGIAQRATAGQTKLAAAAAARRARTRKNASGSKRKRG